MTVTDSTTEDEISSNLKSAKTNQLTSAVISSKSTKKETIEKMIKGVRQEISHKSWTKIILSTNSHLTYNLYIEVLCTYFPKKAVTQPPKAPHSESDDDSEVEYYIPQQSTNTSPFQAMYGRQAKIPIDLLVHLPDQDEQQLRPRTVKSFAKEREQELKQSYEIMKDNIDRRRARSKRNHDDKLLALLLSMLSFMISYDCFSSCSLSLAKLLTVLGLSCCSSWSGRWTSKSIGILACLPYIAWNGDVLVLSWMVVLYAITRLSMWKYQRFFSLGCKVRILTDRAKDWTALWSVESGPLYFNCN